MDVSFRFENVGNGFFGQIYRPVARVTLQSPKTQKFVDVWMIVDTGADHTILPRHIADKLRISLERDCTNDFTFGVGGEQTIYQCKIRVNAKIAHIERKIPLAFFDTNEVPAVMGRLGFIETFDTTFLKNHVVKFRG